MDLKDLRDLKKDLEWAKTAKGRAFINPSTAEKLSELVDECIEREESDDKVAAMYATPRLDFESSLSKKIDADWAGGVTWVDTELSDGMIAWVGPGELARLVPTNLSEERKRLREALSAAWKARCCNG